MKKKYLIKSGRPFRMRFKSGGEKNKLMDVREDNGVYGIEVCITKEEKEWIEIHPEVRGQIINWQVIE